MSKYCKCKYPVVDWNNSLSHCSVCGKEVPIKVAKKKKEKKRKRINIRKRVPNGKGADC